MKKKEIEELKKRLEAANGTLEYLRGAICDLQEKNFKEYINDARTTGMYSGTDFNLRTIEDLGKILSEFT